MCLSVTSLKKSCFYYFHISFSVYSLSTPHSISCICLNENFIISFLNLKCLYVCAAVYSGAIIARKKSYSFHFMIDCVLKFRICVYVHKYIMQRIRNMNANLAYMALMLKNPYKTFFKFIAYQMLVCRVQEGIFIFSYVLKKSFVTFRQLCRNF